MKKLDNLDRQILGYIHEHPGAMYGEIAHALGCQKIMIDSRIQTLYYSGYIVVAEDGIFRLTENALVECTFIVKGSGSAFSSAEFIWDTLYIPKDFS